MKPINFLMLLGIMSSTGWAAEAPDPSLKIREQLRSVTLQLRTAQTDAANAQAAQMAAEQTNAALVAKVADLEKRNASLVKQSGAD